ncbi:DUF3515 family protein [Actinomycetota bacterium]
MPRLPLWAAGLLALSACGSGVEATAPPHADSAACAKAAAAWPETVAGQERRETSAGSDSVAAWGDPAIIARCGVSAIGPTTEQCVDVSGVQWVARQLDDGVQLVTFGRDPAIEVLVPKDYGAAPLLMPAFGKAAQALPTNGHRCS